VHVRTHAHTRLVSQVVLWSTVASLRRGSSVGIATKAMGWTIGFRLPVEAGNFSHCHRFHTGSGAELAAYPMGTTGVSLSLGVKRPGRVADHTPPSSAMVKNAWSYTSTELY
jgi:hypothetical protein